MALSTPAGFGRALNFGRPNPIPMWNKSTVTEYPFPNALGWTQIFQIDVIITPITPTYGVPFIDFVSELRTTIGATSHLVTTITRRSTVRTEIDMLSELASSRITKSAK